MASRARFGALLAEFWLLGRAILVSLGGPNVLLGRLGGVFWLQKSKNEAVQTLLLSAF